VEDEENPFKLSFTGADVVNTSDVMPDDPTCKHK
jgi:hypothetical protein